MRNLQRGFTLLELQLVSVLLMMILSCIYVVMRPGFRYFAQENVAANVEGEVLRGLLAVSNDLHDTQVSNTACGTAPEPYVWMLSPRPPAAESGPIQLSPSGSLIWRKWRCFFLDSGRQELVRSEVALSPATEITTPQPAPQPTFSLFEATVTPSRKAVSRFVTGFEVNHVTSNLFRVAVTVSMPNSSTRFTTRRLQTEVWICNE